MMRPQAPNGSLSNYDPSLDFGTQFVPDQQLRSISFSRIWQTIVHRRRLFFLVAVSLFALIALFSLVQKSHYATYVRMIAGSANSDSSSVANSQSGTTSIAVLNAMLAARGTQTPETYIDLLLQPSIASEVVDKLHLNATPSAVLAAVKAHPVPDTAIISLTVNWTDAQTSAAIANAWAAGFEERETAIIAQQADLLLKTTRDQLPDAEQKVTSAQNELAEYQQDAGIADLPTQTQTIITNEAAQEAKLNTAIGDNQQAQSALADVQSELASTAPTT